MNTQRLVWIMTIALCSIIGAMLGWSLGYMYVHAQIQGGSLAGKPLGPVVITTLSFGFAIITARLGSWLANRWVIRWIQHFHDLSVADRVLTILGALLGLLFGVLLIQLLPEDAAWLPLKFCIVAVTMVFGMALLQGMSGEMLRVFPQLEAAESDSGNGPISPPKFLDTNVIIDGRLAELCKTGFIEGALFVPSFVLDEVQYIADSPDSMRRARGRRGLDILNVMREMTMTQTVKGQLKAVPMLHVLTEIPASVHAIDAVDSKLVKLAQELHGSIVTNDFNLNRVAELQGVRVLNINELAQALKPVVLPGEEMTLTIVKEGKEAGQGVGYLEDGTMVVVSEGRRHIGETCKVAITSVLQTVAGKMIFSEIKGMKGPGEDLFDGNNPRADSANRARRK